MTGLIPGVEYDFRVLAGDEDGFPAYMEHLFTWKTTVLPTQLTDPNDVSPIHFSVDKVDATSAKVCEKLFKHFSFRTYSC